MLMGSWHSAIGTWLLARTSTKVYYCHQINALGFSIMNATTFRMHAHEAEPLAETAPIEEISGAALCASGLFVPSTLASIIMVVLVPLDLVFNLFVDYVHPWLPRRHRV